MAKNFFREYNIGYEEKDVSNNEALAQYVIQKSGQMEVPVIEKDGQMIVGFNKAKMKKLFNVK